MSLDVFLTLDNHAGSSGGSGIFVREEGAVKEISRAEWDEKFPDREPVIVTSERDDGEVYSANITHNLSRMAEAAGLETPMWYPGDLGIKTAVELIIPLSAGLGLLESNRERFEQFNPTNEWGDYDGLVRFVRNYLAACNRYPTAVVSVSR
jgi:hypothetical protein